MKFIVRYWSSLLPKECCKVDGKPRWLDYSIHPASKLGLHNALLTVHDRVEVLVANGGRFECAVFWEEESRTEKLSPEAANSLFGSLPPGAVKWLDVGRFLLPEQPHFQHVDERLPEQEQLQLFVQKHAPYKDRNAAPHLFDIDI